MPQFVNNLLNTPSYLAIAVCLILVLLFARKTKRMLRRISGCAFSILTIVKLIHILGFLDMLKK